MRKLLSFLVALALSGAAYATDATNGFAGTWCAGPVIYCDGNLSVSGTVTSAQGVLTTTNLNAYGTNQVLTAVSNAVGVAAGTTAAAINGANITNLTLAGNIAAARLTNAVLGATMFGSIPTSTNGLVTGQLWSNSGVLTIKP